MDFTSSWTVTLPRASDANQFHGGLLGQPGPAHDQNLPHLFIVHMIFLELIEALRMHADCIELRHIGLVNFAAACR